MATLYDVVNRGARGSLAKELIGLRADGLTIVQIRDRFAELGIDVSRETVRRWLARAEKEAA